MKPFSEPFTSQPSNTFFSPFMSSPTNRLDVKTGQMSNPQALSTPATPVAPTVPTTETPTQTDKQLKPVNWTAIRSALLKKYPSATKTQIDDLDKKIIKAQTWETIKTGKFDQKYMEEIRKTYPDLYTRAVSEGLTTNNELSETSKDVLSTVQDLLNMNTDQITGIPDIRAFIPGTKAQRTKNTYERLKALLSLENVSLLKGTGAISDFEAKMLSQASTELGTNLSNEDFKDVLAKLKAGLEKAPEMNKKSTNIGRFKVEVE